MMYVAHGKRPLHIIFKEIHMAKRGRKVTFHGAFSSKAKAKRKEHISVGAYIRRVKIKGHVRWLVLTRRGR